MAASPLTHCLLLSYSIVLAVLFLAILVLCVIGIGRSGSFTWPFVIGLLTAILNLVICVFGIIGSFYDHQKRPKYAFCLIVFYIFSIIFAIIFVLQGFIFILVRPALDIVKLAPFMTVHDILKRFDLKDSEATKIPELLDSLRNIFLIIGLICLFVAVCSCVTIVAGSLHMGRKNFQKFYTIIGSLMCLSLGILILFVTVSDLKISKITDLGSLRSASYVLLVVGVLLVLISITGIILACCLSNKNRVLITFSLIAMILIGILLAIGIIILFVASGNYKVKSSFCEDLKEDDKFNCTHFVDSYTSFTCASDDETCKAEDHMPQVLDILSTTARVGIRILLVPCIIMLLIIGFIIVALIMSCKQKDSSDDSISAEMPGYRKQTDALY